MRCIFQVSSLNDRLNNRKTNIGLLYISCLLIEVPFSPSVSRNRLCTNQVCWGAGGGTYRVLSPA